MVLSFLFGFAFVLQEQLAPPLLLKQLPESGNKFLLLLKKANIMKPKTGQVQNRWGDGNGGFAKKR